MKTLVEFVDSLVDTKTKWFNWKLGAMGGTFSGGVNYLVNDSDGIWEGALGGGNQFMFNFLFGGVNTKFCEYLAKKYNNQYIATAMASILPATASFVANYLWHDVLQTPEPFYSSVWQVPLNALSAGVFGYRWYLKGKEEKNKNLSNQSLKNSQNL